MNETRNEERERRELVNAAFISFVDTAEHDGKYKLLAHISKPLISSSEGTLVSLPAHPTPR